MVITKKLAVLATIGVAVASISFAQVSFQNTVSTGIVDLYGTGTPTPTFDGLYDEVILGFHSQRVEAGIYGKFGLSRIVTDGDTDSTGTAINLLGLSWTGSGSDIFQYGGYDWFIDFKAFPFMSIIFSDDIYAYGSYLPVFKGNLETGNLGSDFGVTFRFLKNSLRVGLGADFGMGDRTTNTALTAAGTTDVDTRTPANIASLASISSTVTTVNHIATGSPTAYSTKVTKGREFDVNFFNLKEKAPGLNFGIEYLYKDIFSVGATGRNLLTIAEGTFGNNAKKYKNKTGTTKDNPEDSWGFGVYGSYTGNKNMLITGGFSWNDDGVFGDYFEVDGTLISFGFAAGNEQLEIGFDFVTAILDTMGLKRNNTSGYDIYSALSGTFHVNERFAVNMVLRGTASIIEGYSSIFEAYPNVSWQLNRHHSFGAGADLLLTKGYYNINFPIYWSYRM